MSGRRVRTVLFVDIAGSTEHALKVGDRAWRELLERFRASVRKQLKQYGGEEIDTAGDGFFVTFEGAGRAIRCARAILDAVRPLGLEARAGVHIGEVEVYGASVSGVAVHVGARLVALAKPNEVIVSAPLRELVGGSNIELRDRGNHELKGLPGMWRVYAVSSA
jgi:class 3 adenylate cyclase